MHSQGVLCSTVRSLETEDSAWCCIEPFTATKGVEKKPLMISDFSGRFCAAGLMNYADVALRVYHYRISIMLKVTSFVLPLEQHKRTLLNYVCMQP